MCYERRRAEAGVVCEFVTAALIAKLFVWGGNNGGHVLRETTS